MLYRRNRTLQRLAQATAIVGALAFSSSAHAQNHSSSSLLVKVISGVNIADIAANYNVSVSGGVPDLSIYRITAPNAAAASVVAKILSYDQRVTFSQGDSGVQISEITAAPFQLAFDDGFDAGGYVNQGAYAQVDQGNINVLPSYRRSIVAVLDTGVNANHPALAGKLLPGANFVEPGTAPSDVPDGANNNALGHGTMVTGIVTAVSPNSVVLPVKVLNSDGVGTILNVISGIHYAVRHGADVINMSFGTAQYSPALETALEEAANNGVVLVAAAGNASSNAPTYPAASNVVIGVGAVNADNTLASFSNYGVDVSVVAPGVGIYSTYYTGGYASWSGTSFAAPFVSGEAGELAARHPFWNSYFLGWLIVGTSDSVDSLNQGYAGQLGTGIIDIQEALHPDF